MAVLALTSVPSRRPCENRGTVGAGEAGLLNGAEIESRYASEERAKNLVVEILVDGERDHPPKFLRARARGELGADPR